jgi:hypothetical protein
MFGEISAALGSVKALTEIVKGMSALRQEADLNAKTVEMTGAIIEIQQRLLAASEVMEKHQETIKDLKRQLEEKQRLEDFERVRLPTGVTVYQLKKDKQADAATEYFLCPRCYEKDRILITL